MLKVLPNYDIKNLLTCIYSFWAFFFMDPDYFGSVPDFLSDPDLDSGNKSDPDPDKKTRIRNTGFTFYIPVLGSSVAEPPPF